MREPLRRLAADDWVLGIAGAIAIAYATVRLLESIVEAALLVGDGPRGEGFGSYLGVTINDRFVYLQPVARSAIVFVVVVLLVALLLHRIRERPAEEPPPA